MRRSIATVSMSGTLRRKLEVIAAARFDEATTRRVYDRSPEGAFLHAYAEPLADRFFFAVVQRKAYDGYGAVDASARMAAQEQNAESTRK